MSEGFLGRWAKRKEAVREGKAVPPEPETPPAEPPPAASPQAGRRDAGLPSALTEGGGAAAAAERSGAQEPPPPLPTLEDARALTAESDFKPFMRTGVPADVKNAAMKKLFADPHFNVMDRLDTYIDDYSQPDPIPPAMLRQLASAKFLNLFAEEEKQEQAERDAAARRSGREVADDPGGESVAQSGTVPGPAVPPDTESHADPDLRLQQDDAPGPAGPGEGPR